MTVKRRLLRYASAAPTGSARRSEAFVLTPLAKQDLDDTWEYIADDSVEAADRVLQAKPLQIIRVLHAAHDVQGILGFPPEVL